MKNKTLAFMLALLVIWALTTAAFALQAATRIRFARGKSAAAVKGVVGKYGKKDYVVGASKSQVLTASVSSSCESVTLEVIDKGTGQTLTESPVTEYSDEISGTGDFILRVQNSDLPACKFTLNVGIE